MQVVGYLSQRKYHDAVYEHKLVTEEGLSYVRSFIVITINFPSSSVWLVLLLTNA